MSGSGVYYTPGQIQAMNNALANAQAAFDAGAYDSVSSWISTYYGLQIYNPGTGDVMRGYAIEAQDVANDTGLGVVANTEVGQAVSIPQFTPSFRASLELSLASADSSVINTNGNQVPTLEDVANYHANVFEDYGIPITSWGGAAYDALGQDYTLGFATQPELSAISAPQFANMTDTQIQLAMFKLEQAGLTSLSSPNMSHIGLAIASMAQLGGVDKQDSRIG